MHRVTQACRLRLWRPGSHPNSGHFPTVKFCTHMQNIISFWSLLGSSWCFVWLGDFAAQTPGPRRKPKRPKCGLHGCPPFASTPFVDRAYKLGTKWHSHTSPGSSSEKKKKKVEEEGGPRDQRAVKKLDEWLGIKPKVPLAWQRLEEMLNSTMDLIRPKKRQLPDSPAQPRPLVNVGAPKPPAWALSTATMSSSKSTIVHPNSSISVGVAKPPPPAKSPSASKSKKSSKGK